MRVLLVSANTERLNAPTLPLGLSLVAAATERAGHEVTYLDLLGEGSPCEAVRRACETSRPEVIGISVRNIDDQCMQAPQFLLEPVQEIVGACRATTAAPIVLGGAGYSIFPGATLAYLGADFGISGDGEVVFPALLECLAQHVAPWQLPGLHAPGRLPAAPRAIERDLDALPLSGDELWAAADPGDKELWIPVQTRRGCPLECSYCSTALVQGRSIRSRDPRRVVEFMARAAGAGFRRFHFVDNTFNLPRSYALALCREIRAIGHELSWRCILYPHRIDDELVKALEEAGCVEASLGFESGSEPILHLMNKRFDTEEVRAISDRLAQAGIRRWGFLLLGGPGETVETIEESLAFAASLRLDMLKVTAGIRIYPGTPLAATALREGLIEPGDDLLAPRFYVVPGLEGYLAKRLGEIS
ncbi:MAG: radical SAM protein [Planctomycetota bacterium]